MSEHAHLTAVVRLVRDHIGEHGRAWSPRAGPPVAMKFFDAATGESLRQHLRTEGCTLRESSLDFLLRAAGAIEPGWRLAVRRRQPKPLAANIVDVREDGSDGARFAAGELGAPRARVEMLEHELVHAVVDRPGFQHALE